MTSECTQTRYCTMHVMSLPNVGINWEKWKNGSISLASLFSFVFGSRTGPFSLFELQFKFWNGLFNHIDALHGYHSRSFAMINMQLCVKNKHSILITVHDILASKCLSGCTDFHVSQKSSAVNPFWGIPFQDGFELYSWHK